MEIQVNGGDVADKVDFCDKPLREAGARRRRLRAERDARRHRRHQGSGLRGRHRRAGARTRLPRKTHRGLRKVACIGAWHPAKVQYSVARPGQNGFHHRTEMNKKVRNPQPQP